MKRNFIMNWQAILSTFADGCVRIAWRLVTAVLLLIVGRIVIKFIIRKIKRNQRIKDRLDPTVRKFIINIVKFGLYAILTTLIIGTLGVEMTSIIAVFASAGAAIALAVKGAFSNLVGGIMLLIFKPISIEDFVEISGKSGTVEDVGLFYTQLRTPDNLTVNVPNSIMVDSVTINYSKKPNRRLDLAIEVAYGTDIEKAKQVITDTVTSHEKVLADPAPFVRMTQMNDSSIQITARVWCEKSEFGVLKSDLLEMLNSALEENSIEIPFPQLDVHTK